MNYFASSQWLSVVALCAGHVGNSPDREEARRELVNAELASARAKARAHIAAKVIRGFFEPKGGMK